MLTALDDSGIRVFGALRKSTAGVVQLTLPIPLPAQTRVSLRLADDVDTEGEIASCEKHEAAYLVNVAVSNELRREPRFDVNDPVRITVINVPDYPCIDGQISNLSKSGLALTVPAAVPPGCQVKIELNDGVVLGEVRHCKKAGDEFTAGVAIETVVFRGNNDPDHSSVPRQPESLWSALKRLYKAVTRSTDS